MLDRITVTPPQGAESLLFWKMSGMEVMSRSFALNITMLSKDGNIDRKALLGKSLTVSVPTQNRTPRYFNGKITEVNLQGTELNGVRYAVYILKMESDLWPLLRDRNQRIFQNQRVPDIIKTVLGEYGVKTEDKLTGQYRNWEYCVQYQESSYNFISRLMELEGIYFFFRHESDSHTLVMMDSAEHHQPWPGYETVPYHTSLSGGSTSEEGIGQWAISERVTPGLYSIDDYDFRKPNAWMFQARQNPASPSPGQIDYYEWPGRFVEHQHGEFYARIRQEEWQAEQHRIDASGTALGITPGYTFSLRNPPFAGNRSEYLVVSASYTLEENSYASGNMTDSVHQINFVVIPAETTFRSAQRTEWPRTHGPQTARVVGPQGESIWTDKYGRVKVKFHWDRHAKGDDTSSCWVRVSSAWAGQGFGGVQIPRVGDEVVIDFINGDPDRPIITGRVYNEASMPPWELPADSTKMGFMTRSKDGSKDNASYLFFEDKLGSESIDLHSERDMNVSVEGVHTETVHKETIYTHKLTRSVTVDDHDTQTFNKGQTLSVTANGRQETIVDNEKKSVTGYSDNSYTSNLIIKTDATVSTLAADKIMYEVPEVVFGQVIDAVGTPTAVTPVPFDISKTVGPVMSAPGSMLSPVDYMASASSAAISAATKVTYKKGVVTHVEGVDKLTIDQNQLIEVKGNTSRSISGKLSEYVLGGIDIYSPKKITIKSDEKVEVISPSEYFEYKNASASMKINDISLNFTSLGINPLLGISVNGLKIENKAAALKREGGKFEVHIGGTETKISSFSQYMSALTSFF
ncbi:type VI secretion system tip protein VgrG [Kosakonia sp. ML.JS2a]|uniref:type VI secretion system Vgr family protein n=1 Tax=Kosakonia sp. ML.JS2a TaxID=2980557 RepID=UPI0021D92C76|nr:type VI secretion system tip protein TssI/VgrG [Kosakonia sp. ML.JS2a]UXY09491.1 type VI secretion system tip protein VgrG [Kosakonia sp. ML.JS2a]